MEAIVVGDAVRSTAPDVSTVRRRTYSGAVWRVAWTVLIIVVVEALVCGTAFLPVLLIWSRAFALTESSRVLRVITFSMVVVPS
jgi:hypothetical protein